MSEDEGREPGGSAPETGETPAAGAPRCQYPGCTRAARVRLSGSGRQSRYCDEIVLGTRHDRSNAQTRRRQLKELGVTAESAATEPVSTARAAATDLVGRLETAIREQNTMLTKTLNALGTMGSAEQAATQVEATSAAAQAQIAVARAEQAEAQRRVELAESTVAQALADAEDADADATAARADAETARAADAAAQTARQDALEQLAGTRAELAAQVEATTQSVQRSERAEARAEQLDTDLTGARAELSQTRAAAAAAATAAAARAEADAATIAGLTTDVDTARQETARLEQVLATEKEQHAATGRDLQTTTTELALARAEAATAAAVARAQADAAAATIAGLREDLTTARTTLDTSHRDLVAEQDRHQATRQRLDDLREQFAQLRTDAATAAAIAQGQADTAAATIARLQGKS